MRLNRTTSTLTYLVAFLSGTILSLSSTRGLSQGLSADNTSYPTDFFRPPLDLPPALAGSFGEIRGNHFHSGLDYRTNQREGYPVYAVADGYISRLRVQIGGFGNALYITHPNGFTSVYAHLQRFNDRITQTLRDFQYRKETYDVDFPLLPIEIPVKKGEIIAWSGNTGSSGGPHLHFEIRDTQTEETINPQLFGIDIPDKVKPQISGLVVYQLNGIPFNAGISKRSVAVSGSNGNYQASVPVIAINGETGFGIVTYDQQFNGGNKNGVYSIELELDGQVIYASALERFAFSNSRAINSHIDYPALLLSRSTIQKSFIEPGNPLRIYKKEVNRGIIHLSDDAVHEMRYTVKDVKGNSSTLEFRVKNDPNLLIKSKEPSGVKRFLYNSDNEFIAENIRLRIPKGLLYNDLNFTYSKASQSQGYSDRHTLHSRLTPLHSNFDLWIKPTKEIPAHLRNKALLMSTSGGASVGTYEDGYVKASPRAFGTYYIAVDTIAPRITPLNISDDKRMTGIGRMSFKISDNLSGIQTFRGTIDGQWILMEYDLKTSTLWHTFDYRTAPGKHLLQLTVIDRQGNTKTYTASFYK